MPAAVLNADTIPQELSRKALVFHPPAATLKSWPSHRSAPRIAKISHSTSMLILSRPWEHSGLRYLTSGIGQSNPSKLISKKLSFEQSSGVIESGTSGRRAVTIRPLHRAGSTALDAGLGWRIAWVERNGHRGCPEPSSSLRKSQGR